MGGGGTPREPGSQAPGRPWRGWGTRLRGEQAGEAQGSRPRLGRRVGGAAPRVCWLASSGPDGPVGLSPRPGAGRSRSAWQVRCLAAPSGAPVRPCGVRGTGRGSEGLRGVPPPLCYPPHPSSRGTRLATKLGVQFCCPSPNPS